MRYGCLKNLECWKLRIIWSYNEVWMFEKFGVLEVEDNLFILHAPGSSCMYMTV